MQFFDKITRGKFVLLYLPLFLICQALFYSIGDEYITRGCQVDGKPCHAIDVDFRDSHTPFHYRYVEKAAHQCYIKSGYFRTFFPLDMLFPLVYSLLVASIINLNNIRRGRRILIAAIVIGALLDYGEDFSFAIYLNTDAEPLAHLTSIFTTFKTFFFVFNLLLGSVLLLWWLGTRLYYRFIK